MAKTTCRLCSQHNDQRACAFGLAGHQFDQHNHACATMLALREFAEQHGYHARDDLASASIGVLRIPDTCEASGYIVMTWYKDRGRTPRAYVLYDDNDAVALDLATAEQTLAAWRGGA